MFTGCIQKNCKCVSSCGSNFLQISLASLCLNAVFQKSIFLKEWSKTNKVTQLRWLQELQVAEGRGMC